MNDAFIGRQPIYSPKLEIAAYEVLFRHSQENYASFDDADQATAKLIVNLLSEIGFDQIVGQHKAFINVTENFLLDGHAAVLPRNRVVLEVLEDIKPTPQVIKALKNLSDRGFSIALDDFVYSPELQPLVDIADIIKVELPAIAVEDLPAHVEKLRESKAELLAEKVETYEEFKRCKKLGFDYFQGYFFCKPNVIRGKRVPVNRLAALRLLNRLRDSNSTAAQLTQIVSTEPSLCYKLLRFVNSASCGLSQRIDSIQTAITLVGLKRLNAFVRLALLSEVADGKPTHLVVTSLTRARMCELLAQKSCREHPESYFVAGLFTVLDALVDLPMADALNSLQLDPEIVAAILKQGGPVEDIVQCVVNYDQTEFEQVHLANVSSDIIRDCYLEAVAWTVETSLDAGMLM